MIRRAVVPVCASLATGAGLPAAAAPSLSVVTTFGLPSCRHCSDTLAAMSETAVAGGQTMGSFVSTVAEADVTDDSLPRTHQQWERDDTIKGMIGPLTELIVACKPCPNTDEIVKMLHAAKNAKDVRKVYDKHITTQPLYHDVLNGHGMRVAMISRITTVAARTKALNEWFDCMEHARRFGFQTTRTFAAEGFNIIKEWVKHRFNVDGRHPQIVLAALERTRQLVHICREDRLNFDFVLYGRCIMIATVLASTFDRQNVYRGSFPNEVVKRDGVVTDWTITHERTTDFDEAVLLCEEFVEELLDNYRAQMKTRPNFSLLYRLQDFYFASDNFEKLLATIEDCEAMGAPIAESTTAKLIQMAVAFNIPETPELFYRFRASKPQCSLQPADMSRLMAFRVRGGGGKPCPHCGEKYNHRNVGVHVWQATPEHQKKCPLLQMARTRRGELEDSIELGLPQVQDLSAFALQCLSLTGEKFTWGVPEWRFFLMCCCFAKEKAVVAEVEKVFLERFPEEKWDEVMRSTYARFLRHHAPERVREMQRKYCKPRKPAPYILHEAVLAAVLVDDQEERVIGLEEAASKTKEFDLYVAPYAIRFLRRATMNRYHEGGAAAGTTAASAGSDSKDRAAAALGWWAPGENDALGKRERAALTKLFRMAPRRSSEAEVKDSSTDILPGRTKRNVFHAQGT